LRGEVVPYEIQKKGCSIGKPYGVFKVGDDKPLGCHATVKAAQRQIAAIEANEEEGS
jgi:hypothetical protein